MIDRATRIPLFVVFSIVSAAGLVLFIFMIWRTYIEKRRDDLNINPSDEPPKQSRLADIGQTLKTAWKLLQTRNMLLLIIVFAYSGKELILIILKNLL
jgi:hypothetical protein